MKEAELRKIIWLDSNRHDGWHDPNAQTYKPLKVTSVGWVIHECEEGITLSGSVVFGEEYQAADTMTIPKVCVVSDKKLATR